MDYRVLGPLLQAVRDDGVRGKLRPRERELVTVLLVLAWSPVSRQTLEHALWGENPPSNPDAALRTLFSRARTALGRSESRLTAVQGAYLADPPPQDLDMGRFLNLRIEAGQLIRQNKLRAASIKLGQALGCWREPALVNLPAAPEIDAQRTRLLEQQKATMLAWADTLLELGDHDRILPILHARAVVIEPLGERFQAQFIAALHQSGRREAALAAYGQARAELVRTFGTEPGAELQHLLHLVRTGTPPAPRYFAAQLMTAQATAGPTPPGPLSPGRGRTGAAR